MSSQDKTPNEPHIVALKLAESFYPLGGTPPPFTFTIGPEIDPSIPVDVSLAQKTGDMRKDTNRSRRELETRLWNGGLWFHTLDIYKQHFIVQWVDSEAHGRHLCKWYGQKKRLGKTPVAYPLGNTTLPRPTPALPAYQSNHGGAPVPAAQSGPVRPRAPSQGVASVVELGEEEDEDGISATMETAVSRRPKRPHEDLMATTLGEDVTHDEDPAQPPAAAKRRCSSPQLPGWVTPPTPISEWVDPPTPIGYTQEPSSDQQSDADAEEIQNRIQQRQLRIEFYAARAEVLESELEKAKMEAEARAKNSARR